MPLAKTRFTDAHRNLDETTENGEDQGCKRKAVRRTPLPKCASYQDVQSSAMVVQANISLQKLFYQDVQLVEICGFNHSLF